MFAGGRSILEARCFNLMNLQQQGGGSARARKSRLFAKAGLSLILEIAALFPAPAKRRAQPEGHTSGRGIKPWREVAVGRCLGAQMQMPIEQDGRAFIIVVYKQPYSAWMMCDQAKVSFVFPGKRKNYVDRPGCYEKYEFVFATTACTPGPRSQIPKEQARSGRNASFRRLPAVRGGIDHHRSRQHPHTIFTIAVTCVRWLG